MNLIVALGKDGAIGRKGDLIWKLPGDLKRFKEITMGHPVIMGRKTWESLPKKPLPGRLNIVLTRNADFNPEGAVRAKSLQEAITLCEKYASQNNGDSDACPEPFIIGGAEIYRMALPLATHLYITHVDDVCEDADAFLHIDFDKDWKLTDISEPVTSNEGVTFCYASYNRI